MLQTRQRNLPGFFMTIELTPQRLNQLLTDLDFTNVDAAHFAGCNPSTVHRWLTAESPIPASVIRMFTLMLHIQKGAALCQVSWSEPGNDRERPREPQLEHRQPVA